MENNIEIKSQDQLKYQEFISKFEDKKYPFWLLKLFQSNDSNEEEKDYNEDKEGEDKDNVLITNIDFTDSLDKFCSLFQSCINLGFQAIVFKKCKFPKISGKDMKNYSFMTPPWKLRPLLKVTIIE